MVETAEMSSGVQELINKLREQGVAEGQQQAHGIIQDAQNEAARIISKAQSQAESILSDAHRKIEVERTSAHEAIKIAFRDTELALRSNFREAFSAHLKRLVSYAMQDQDFIKQLVLVVAGMKTSEVASAARIEILVPANLFESDKRDPRLTPEGKQRLQHLVLGITNEMLREGVDLQVSSDFTGGIRVRLVGEDLEIDLSDDALSNLLLKFLLPRYREIVSGQG